MDADETSLNEAWRPHVRRFMETEHDLDPWFTEERLMQMMRKTALPPTPSPDGR